MHVIVVVSTFEIEKMADQKGQPCQIHLW